MDYVKQKSAVEIINNYNPELTYDHIFFVDAEEIMKSRDRAMKLYAKN